MNKTQSVMLVPLIAQCIALTLACSAAAIEASNAPADEPLRIAFFNPGHEQSNNPTGQFWPESSRFAKAVAQQLKIELDVYYANRNYHRMQRQIVDVLRRNNRPDYLLLVNERFALTPLIRDINKAGVDFFLAYNDLEKPSDQTAPAPRRDYKHWIGSLVPDNRYAGYALAEHLIEQMQPEPAHLLVLTGDKITSAARLREAGLKRAVDNYSNAKIHEQLVGNWGYALPRDKIRGLLLRHSGVNVIWSANGPMALGAIQGINSSTMVLPSITIGSINWDSEELVAIEADQLAVSFGGHFMTAGISLILLNDYHHGIDFEGDGGLYQ